MGECKGAGAKMGPLEPWPGAPTSRPRAGEVRACCKRPQAVAAPGARGGRALAA